MTVLYTTGELARISKTTVRTLRYYDEVGILKPSQVSDGGHRYYDEEAITDLHYILTLKEIGFDLEKIKDIMTNQKTSPKELLHMRLEMITGEIQELEKSKRIIQGAIQIMEIGGHENWEELFSTFKQSYFNQKNIAKNRRKYLTEEEQKKLGNLPKLGENTQLISRWLGLLKDIRAAMKEGRAPESAEGQKFAHRWSALVREMYNGEGKLAQKAWKIQRYNAANLGLVNIDEKIVHFIEAAMEYTHIREGDTNE